MNVETVLPDACISGLAEANASAKKFAKAGVNITLTVASSWCYCSETMDADPFTQKAIWGFNGSEAPGAVYLAAVMASHNQNGLPAFSIYGKDVQSADDDSVPLDVEEKILSFFRAALAVSWMKDKSYLAMGGVSMGIGGSSVNESFFRSYLGMRNEYVDMTEFTRRIERNIFDSREYEKALSWTKENCREGEDFNPPEKQRSRNQKDEDWETVVKMTLIARDLMVGNPELEELGFNEEALGHNAILSGFQGHRHWTSHYPNSDFTETVLNSSFDWNGARQPYLISTENDSLNGVSMLFGHLLTGTAQVFADIRTYWSPNAVKNATGWIPEGDAQDGFIHLINSGSAAMDGTGEQCKDGLPAIKPHWELKNDEIAKCLKATTWHPASHKLAQGGFSTSFLTKGGMPATLTRLNLVKGIGPVMQLAEGFTLSLPENIHAVLNERTSPAWPTTWFVPRISENNRAFKDVYSVMNNWGANHGSISFGHIGADLISMASMLRIPVCMHNVDEEKIFRPSYWNAFGMDSENADYRSCQNLGALYGKY
jgi:L-fucose isomerase